MFYWINAYAAYLFCLNQNVKNPQQSVIRNWQYVQPENYMKPKPLVVLMILSILSGCSEAPRANEAKTAPQDTVDTRISKVLRDFITRPIYRRLTKQIIDSTSDEKLVQVVFDNLTQKLPADYTEEYETVMGWNKARQAVYMIWLLESDVNNGGYNQFYTNASPPFYPYLPDALKLVDANRLSDLTQRANETFKEQQERFEELPDSTRDEFQKSYSSDLFTKFDNEFFKLSEVENLDQLQVDFIRKNKEKFIDN